MTIDYSALALPKPEPAKRTKARKDRLEDRVAKAVRLKVEARDGACRLARVHPCQGVSQWAHFGQYRRFNTRGRAADERHTTVGSLMLCEAAHAAYDEHRLDIDALTDRGCDGQLRVTFGGGRVALV